MQDMTCSETRPSRLSCPSGLTVKSVRLLVFPITISTKIAHIVAAKFVIEALATQSQHLGGGCAIVTRELQRGRDA